MTRLAAPLIAGLIATTLATVGPQSTDWRDDLRKPISPGSLVLLVEHPDDRAVVERWAAGLKDSNPPVRAAAARAASVSNATELLPGLIAALERETNADAGVEEIRAIVSLGGEPAYPSLLATAQRLGPWAVRAYAGMIARVRSGSALAVLNVLELPDGDRQSVSRLALGASRETVPAEGQIIRSIGDLPAGLLTDLVRVTGCRLSRDRLVGGAEIVYDGVGRARQVAFLKSALSGECQEAVQAALRAAFGSPTVAAGTPQVVLAVMDADVIACLDRRVSDVAGTMGLPSGPRAGIRPPQKIWDLKPVYPPEAQRDRTTGIVIGEAVVGPSGCIQSLRVLQYPAFSLAVASVQAVSGWQYTPTLVNGEAVPVIMTWVTNFALQ